MSNSYSLLNKWPESRALTSTMILTVHWRTFYPHVAQLAAGSHHWRGNHSWWLHWILHTRNNGGKGQGNWSPCWHDTVSLRSFVVMLRLVLYAIHALHIVDSQADFENRVEIEVERRRKLLLTTPATADTGASLAVHSSVRSPSKSTD